jgi:hypothetical protein
VRSHPLMPLFECRAFGSSGSGRAARVRSSTTWNLGRFPGLSDGQDEREGFLVLLATHGWSPATTVELSGQWNPATGCELRVPVSGHAWSRLSVSTNGAETTMIDAAGVQGLLEGGVLVYGGARRAVCCAVDGGRAFVGCVSVLHRRCW